MFVGASRREVGRRKSGAMQPGSADALARLLDAPPDAMTIVDADDDFRFVNAAWEALFGYGDGEL
jgi:PAS domain-containing protein